MKKKRRYIGFLFLTSLGAACTTHQSERLEELLSPPAIAAKKKKEHLALETLERGRPCLKALLHPAPILSTIKGASPTYLLTAEGLPSHERFLLISVNPFTQAITTHYEFEALEDGSLKLFTKEGVENVPETALVLQDLIHGQPVELAIVSKNNLHYASTCFTPHPFETNIGNADFSLLMTHRKATHFILEGKGLIPGEEVIVTEISGSQTKRHLLFANREGTVALPIEPIVLGSLGGPASVAISLHRGQGTLDYFWGERLTWESRKETHFYPLIFATHSDFTESDYLALLSQIEKKLSLS